MFRDIKEIYDKRFQPTSIEILKQNIPRIPTEHAKISSPLLELIKKKIEIVYIVDVLMPGGYEGRIIRLANSLDKNYFNVKILVLEKTNNNIYDIIDKDIQLIYNENNISRNVFIENILTKTSPDIITYPINCKEIVLSSDAKKYCYIARPDALLNIDINKVDRLIEVSPNKDDYPIEFQSKTICIPTGIDTTIFDAYKSYRDELRGKLGLCNKFLVLWNGRLWDKHKNKDMMMNIIDNLKDNHDITFIINGYFQIKNEEDVFLYDLFKYKDKVIYLNDSKPTDAPIITSMSDAYLLTSDLEGFSNSSLEALAAGLPIISTKAHGQEYLVKHGINGFLENLNDEISLTEDILKIYNMDSRDRYNMGSMSRLICKKEFDLSRYTRDHSLLYISDVLGIPCELK